MSMKKNLIAVAVSMAVTTGMQAQAADDAAQQPIEEVRVTGSRIQYLGMTTPTPVAALSMNELTGWERTPSPAPTA
jgi:hypothetical protein